MPELTRSDLTRILFLRAGDESGDRDPRIPALVRMVLDLLTEVEALRRTILESDLSAGGDESVYGKAYRETAYLTHNSAGPSFGIEKLLALFYPPARSESETESEPRSWRECVFLRRFGFTEEQLQAYRRDAECAETFS